MVRTWFAAGLGAVLLAVTACAPATLTGTARPRVRPTPPRPAAVLSVSDLGAAVRHSATQHDSVHVDVTMTIPATGRITASGDLRFGSSVAERMTMTMPGVGDLRMVLVHGRVYLRLPDGLAGALGSAKPWSEVDAGGSNPLTESLGSETSVAGRADPTQLVQQVAQAGTITRVTSESLGGTPTTHYAATVDVARLVATTGNERQRAALSELDVRTMPFDIWVDGDRLPVRIVSELAYADPISGDSERVDLAATYTRWGEPVAITTPPADQVGSLGRH